MLHDCMDKSTRPVSGEPFTNNPWKNSSNLCIAPCLEFVGGFAGLRFRLGGAGGRTRIQDARAPAPKSRGTLGNITPPAT